MTCKLLALATVAFHLAWPTLTLLGVESASAQTTPSPNSTSSPSPSATPTPTPESTPSPATLGSGPGVVITYEGKLVEFPRYQSGGYYVVEIPEARRSRLIRGDWSACASKNGVTVWSFQNPPETQAILRQDDAAGRIEITFALALQPPSPSPSPDQVRKQELVKRINDLAPGRAAELLKEFGADLPSDDKDARSRLRGMVLSANTEVLTRLESKVLQKGKPRDDQERKKEMLNRIDHLAPGRADEVLGELGADRGSDDADAKSRLRGMVLSASSEVLTRLESKLSK